MAYPRHHVRIGSSIPIPGFDWPMPAAVPLYGDPTRRVIVILVLLVLAAHGYPWPMP